MAGDALDHAWAALRGYGVDPADYDDVGPELEEDQSDDAEHCVCEICTGDAFKIAALGLDDVYRCSECGEISVPALGDAEEDDELE